MNELQVFKNEEFGEIRTITREDGPWFVGADVCRALELDNVSQALSRLDEDEKHTTIILNESAATGQSYAAFVNEAGLYALILGSRKPQARAFKRWVTHDVLPSIRRHGGYLTPQKVEEALLNPDVLIRLATDLKEEREARRRLEAAVEADKPYTGFAKAIAANSDAILIGDFAKLVCNSGINIGRTRLFRWLREKGYLMHGNKPYQRYVDQGLFRVKESSITTIKGDMIKTTTLVTGKGQMVLLNALQEQFAA